MWIFVHFDLPTETKKERKAYSDFRKKLLNDGFKMMQYSMYARHCSSRENAAVHKKRVIANMPDYGEIIIFEITDVQFGRMEFYKCTKPAPPTQQSKQLTLF